MQPTLCSRCKKNVAVIFITRIENGESHNEGLCLRCARELRLVQVADRRHHPVQALVDQDARVVAQRVAVVRVEARRQTPRKNLLSALSGR